MAHLWYADVQGRRSALNLLLSLRLYEMYLSFYGLLVALGLGFGVAGILAYLANGFTDVSSKKEEKKEEGSDRLGPAVIQSMFRRSVQHATDMRELETAFTARLMNLSAVYRHLSEQQWQPLSTRWDIG